MYICIVQEKDIHVTNRDRSDHWVFEKGRLVVVWDGKGEREGWKS